MMVMVSYEFMRINLDWGFNLVVTYFYNACSALRSISSITKMMWIEVASYLVRDLLFIVVQYGSENDL